MLNTTRQWLNRLLEAGALPVSSVPKAAKGEIANIHNVGFILWGKSGAGAKYTVKDELAIRNLLQSTGFNGELDLLTPKAKAVALHGDAHKGRDSSLLLMLSAAAPSVTWSDGENTLHGLLLGLYAPPRRFLPRQGDTWKTDKPLGLVENLDLVVYGREYFRRIGFEGSVLYYSGWLSNALLDWLTETDRAPEYTIFPDYDLVGLKNYIRAKERLGGCLDIHIPTDLKGLLKKYGNTEKLKKDVDRGVIEKSTDPKVNTIYTAMIELGAGLDQESLLLVDR